MGRPVTISGIGGHLRRNAHGYGRLCDRDHPPVTEAEAEAYLAEDLREALEGTLRYCPVLAGAGRLQISTLRRRINERDWVAAQTEIRRWVYGGGEVLPGLVARREAEAELL